LSRRAETEHALHAEELGSWVERLRADRSASHEAFLVTCAAVLGVLDQFHKAQRLEVHGTTVSLPAELGGGETLFLEPPPDALAELVPSADRLVRSVGDLGKDLRTELGFWWHPVHLEELAQRPIVTRVPQPLWGLLEERFEARGDLSIVLASPFQEVEFQASTDHTKRHPVKGDPYHFWEVLTESTVTMEGELTAILELCRAWKGDILCFPELTLDTVAKEQLIALLRRDNSDRYPALVVAGSYHLDPGTGRVNRSVLLDGHGNLIASQDKCTPFRLPGPRVEDMPAELQKVLGLGPTGGYEDIQPGRELALVETPWARLAFPICLDYCGTDLDGLFVATATNFFLVPAMSPRMQPFHERARALGTSNRATSLGVNSSWLLGRLGLELGPENLHLAYVPSSHVDRRAARTASPGDHRVVVCSIRELLGLTMVH